ncbi:MAG TPA: transglutaminase family protein, partial [Candidatus Binataceae bacterium]|nr:transglutaminase family protein [Candidatus Binataceae bacterium]
MSIRVALNHKTDYRYDRLVSLSPQVIRLRPAPHCRTKIEAYSLKIEPQGYFINWQQDPQSNYLARVVFPNEVRHFSVEVDLIADMAVTNPFDFFLEPYAERFPFSYEPELLGELTPYLHKIAAGPKLSAFLKDIDLSPKRSVDFLVDLNQRLQHAVGYVIRLEPGIQSCEETLTLKTGSCRDSAYLMVEVLRHLGLAARFVSGYLIQLKPDVKPLEGPEGPVQDFTDLHAWAEVYLPGAGWIGLDPTSGLFAGEGHIPLATTPEPSSAAPVSGSVGPCEVEFHHEMSVTRIHEDPRVTLPYTDEQWNRIESLGFQIDGEISSYDIRLTMGGEPTFVSIDDMDGAEWNTAALGPHKRELSEQLLLRLQKRFAPGGLLHYGQGKWYPGEQLPRWALNCYWRRDGVPMWRDHALIARVDQPSHFGVDDARRFAQTLAMVLGVDPGYANAAFEDPIHFIQRERQLPINVDPVDNHLDDPSERERMRRVFERGLETPVGYVLPLQRGFGKSGPEWQTGLWMLRGQHLFLVPGDSPIGLRLSLPSLPWVSSSEAPQYMPRDPMAMLGPLPVPERITAPPPAL